jgi:hypothetical protein
MPQGHSVGGRVLGACAVPREWAVVQKPATGAHSPNDTAESRGRPPAARLHHQYGRYPGTAWEWKCVPEEAMGTNWRKTVLVVAAKKYPRMLAQCWLRSLQRNHGRDYWHSRTTIHEWPLLNLNLEGFLPDRVC